MLIHSTISEVKLILLTKTCDHRISGPDHVSPPAARDMGMGSRLNLSGRGCSKIDSRIPYMVNIIIFSIASHEPHHGSKQLQ